MQEKPCEYGNPQRGGARKDGGWVERTTNITGVFYTWNHACLPSLGQEAGKLAGRKKKAKASARTLCASRVEEPSAW